MTRLLLMVPLILCGCDLSDPGDPDRSTGYRSGTIDDDYTSNGERGSINITEVNWAGSVRGSLSSARHDPEDIFIEFRNQSSRPLQLTDWVIIVEPATGELIPDPGHTQAVEYLLPPRENGQPVMPNEYVVLAAQRDGAFPNADYYLEDLFLPASGFEITMRDIDYRLMGDAGDITEQVFAGGYDLRTVRSMERVQLLFSNQGGRESSWHSYSYNPWEPDHLRAISEIASDYQTLTFASPGQPNSPDYSGTTSSGSFE